MTLDRLLAAALCLLAAAYLFATWQLPDPAFGDPLGPKLFPLVIGLLALLGGGLLMAEGAGRRARSARGTGTAAGNRPLAVLAVWGWMLLFFLLLETVGFLLGGACFLFGLAAFFNRGRWIANTAVAVLFPVAVFFLFTRFLGLSLPAGPF